MEFWAFRAAPLCNSFLHIHICLASVTTIKINCFQDFAPAIWMGVSNMLYNPDFVPSEFHLFGSYKKTPWWSEIPK
jgi:hypothetical protein